MRMINEEVIEELLCRRVSIAIAKLCPPGIGGWDRAWEIVEESSQRFLELLPSYHEDEVSKKRVEEAGNDVVRAWKRAIAEYQAARGAS